MATLTSKCATESTVVDRFGMLEQLLDDHINREAEHEAALDAAGRDLRAMINRHSDERRKEIDAAEAHQRRRKKIKTERARVRTLRAAQREAFILRCSGIVAIVAIIGILYATGGVNGWVAAPVVALADLFFIGNLVAYLTRNCKKRYRKKKKGV